MTLQKKRRSIVCIAFILGLLLLSLNPTAPVAHAGDTNLGKAFTYQGVLKQNGTPVNGSVDLLFDLYGQPTGGSSLTSPIFESSYPITDGLLTIDLNFANASSHFAGQKRWLEIRVRPAGVGTYETLAPRQLLTAVPYANGLTVPVALKGNSDPVGICLYAEVGSLNQTALFGQAAAGKGVWGQSDTGLAVYGRSTFGGVGVRGESSVNNPNIGELGNATHGVFGAAGDSSSYGVHGTHNPTGNYGILGLSSYGVYGQSATTGSDAVRGNHVSGNYGILGQSGAGVIGRGQGSAYGVVGENFAVGGTAIYATAPSGKAIHAVNTFSGHAGYFEGFVYFSNNIGLGVTNPTAPIHHSSGAFLSNGGTWVNACDANLKENFQPIDSSAILSKVAALPLHHWNYKAEKDVSHIGPTAQDFRTAFGLGANDVTIGTVDADGIALAAIQALHAQLEAKQAQIETLMRQNSSFEARLAQLEAKLAPPATHSNGDAQ